MKFRRIFALSVFFTSCVQTVWAEGGIAIDEEITVVGPLSIVSTHFDPSTLQLWLIETAEFDGGEPGEELDACDEITAELIMKKMMAGMDAAASETTTIVGWGRWGNSFEFAVNLGAIPDVQKITEAILYVPSAVGPARPINVAADIAAADNSGGHTEKPLRADTLPPPELAYRSMENESPVPDSANFQLSLSFECKPDEHSQPKIYSTTSELPVEMYWHDNRSKHWESDGYEVPPAPVYSFPLDPVCLGIVGNQACENLENRAPCIVPSRQTTITKTTEFGASFSVEGGIALQVLEATLRFTAQERSAVTHQHTYTSEACRVTEWGYSPQRVNWYVTQVHVDFEGNVAETKNGYITTRVDAHPVITGNDPICNCVPSSTQLPPDEIPL